MESIKLLHYRNATYQGQIKSNKRNGKGILVTDLGQIVLGTWKNDRLYGNALIINNPQQYSYCQFNRSELEGWCKFQSLQKILISEFNNNRTINKQLLINKLENTYTITTPTKNFIYDLLKQQQLPSDLEANSSLIQQLALSQLKVKLPAYFNLNLNDYIKETFKANDLFKVQILPNGYSIVKLNDQKSVLELGFIINRNNILISFGTYVNNKLHGYGCKFQNSTRYEGIFENGFLNGEGLKFSTGKYSFGTFQNGTLTHPMYLEQRSLASQQKLKQLQKLYHITNLNFSNQYISQPILCFKGTRQIIFQVSLKQQNLFTSILQKSLSSVSPKKTKNNLMSKLLATNKQQAQAKSNLNFSVSGKKNKNPQEDQSRVSEIGNKSVSGVGSLRKFKI